MIQKGRGHRVGVGGGALVAQVLSIGEGHPISSDFSPTAMTPYGVLGRDGNPRVLRLTIELSLMEITRRSREGSNLPKHA